MPNNDPNRRTAGRRALLAVLCGIAVLGAALVVSIRTDMASTERMLSITTEYIKEQCNRFAKIELASETKSLMRVIESGKQIAHGIADDRALGKEKDLAYYVRDSYVSGAYLLDADGGIETQYHSESTLPGELAEALATRALLDTAAYPEKRYAERFHCADGSEVDVAATAREDAAGVVVAYYHTPASYKDSFSLSVAALLDGYTMEKDGTIAVSSGDTIVASNDPSLVGIKSVDVPILKKLTLFPDGNRLVHSAQTEGVAHDFGLMKRGRDFYVYGYVSERDTFSNSPRVLLYTLLAYIALIAGIAAVRWRTAQSYREEQLRTQAEYAERLQQKNRQLSAAIEHADRANAAKSSFLSRMSHDIRTPLNGIIGLLEINAAHPDDAALNTANRGKMMIAAKHLLSLINDVLQMSKLESGEITLAHEPIDLLALAREVLAIVEQRAADSGVTMITANRADAVKVNWVYGSPLHLRQIFLNIYTNCIKYNRVGGSVTTALECVRETSRTVTYRWTISDTGIGMSEEFLKHVFDPFAQENTDVRSVKHGSGLGMAIVKGLVDQMHGTIEIESEKGVGSTFVITLPFEIADPAEAAQAAHAASTQAGIDGLSLLLAEDNPLNAEIAETLLTDAGAVVTVASNGRQAVQLFAGSPAGTYDAILMDVMMPVMDGLTATKAIRALERPDAATIPIIAMTANAFTEDAEKCIAAGMNAHIAKPLEIDKLKITIARYCKRD